MLLLQSLLVKPSDNVFQIVTQILTLLAILAMLELMSILQLLLLISLVPLVTSLQQSPQMEMLSQVLLLSPIVEMEFMDSHRFGTVLHLFPLVLSQHNAMCSSQDPQTQHQEATDLTKIH